MEGVKEFGASFVDWFKHRLVNPFYGSFAFAWLTVNWRMVMAVLSDKPFTDKIEWIEKHSEPFWYGEGVPLAIAILYIIVGPILYRHVVTYHRRQQNLTRDKLNVIDGQAILTESAARALRSENLRIRAEIKQEREKAEAKEREALDEIAELNKRLQLAQQGLASMQTSTPKAKGVPGGPDRIFVEGLDIVSNNLPEELLSRGVTQLESNLLKQIFSRLNEGVTAYEIRGSSPESTKSISDAIAHLLRLRLVKQVDDVFYLTHGGRNFTGRLLDAG